MSFRECSKYAKAYAKVDWEYGEIGEINNFDEVNIFSEASESSGSSKLSEVSANKIDTLDDKIGILKEDAFFSNSSDAAKFVSGYKEISGPEYWKNEDGRCLRDLRDHSKIIQYLAMENERFPV